MLRRRRSSSGAPAPSSSRTRELVPRLVEAGWTLPAALVGDQPPVATRIGVDAAPWTGVVDGRGAVSPMPGRWTLDWAVGGDDRWYVPAREPGVEQVRIDHAPVVETRMRVPGGHVVHRAYAARGPAHPGGDEWVHVEVENDSKLPIALAWLVRPWDADGLVPLDEVVVRPAPAAPDGGGPWAIHGAGYEAVLPRRPSRWAASGATDPLATVLAGEASASWTEEGVTVVSDDELASVAVLVPVPHTATATISLPLGAPITDGDPGLDLGWPADHPDAAAVARGWSTLAGSGPRLELPDPVLLDAVDAARRSIALCHRVERVAPDDDRRAVPHRHIVSATGRWGAGSRSGSSAPVGEQMELLAALAWWGQHDAVDRALIDWPAGQQRGGGFGDEAATTAALRALAAHAVAAGDPGPARAWLPELGGAVEWLGRRARRSASGSASDGVDPLVVADGLDAGALLLAALDQPAAVEAVAADAATARTRTGDQIRREAAGSDRQYAARALAEPAAIWELLRRSSATWTWPDPERWVGDDGLVAARLLTAVARLLVDDRPDGLALATWLPPAWWGLGWEVHDAPTRWGRLSYAVRWHGDRPAILWERGAPLDGMGEEARLTAPGLDPTWSSVEPRGEALLAAVAPPEGVETGPDVPTTGGVAIAAPPRSVWRPQDPGPDAPSSPSPGPTDPDPGASFT